jgi:hypothetical protein
MMRACGHTRPDLSDRLGAARDNWWNRNSRILDTLAELRRESKMSSRSQALLQYYEATKQRLKGEIDDLMKSGNTAFMANCDDVLRKMNDGRLDYAP